MKYFDVGRDYRDLEATYRETVRHIGRFSLSSSFVVRALLWRLAANRHASARIGRVVATQNLCLDERVVIWARRTVSSHRFDRGGHNRSGARAGSDQRQVPRQRGLEP
jgi:hypothetical protein